MLTLEAVSFRHPGAPAESLRDVSLELPDGAITGLVGGSESGKSTLCLVLAGLAPRATGGRLQGRLLVDGQDVTDRAIHELSDVVVAGLQDPSGQLSMVCDTVFEEVAFGPVNLGLPRADVLERVDDALDRLAIADLRARDPRRLSWGEQQLVIIAGLLAMRSRHLVLDEPLAHLDARAGERVLAALEALAAEGSAVLVAEQRTAALVEVCERVIALDAGRVVVEGPAAEVLTTPEVLARGVEEPPALRLDRLVREAGLPSRGTPIPLPRPAVLDAARRPGEGGASPVTEARLEVVTFEYPSGVRALDGLDLAIAEGTTMGLIGANGSGKTTLARHLVGLLRPTSGRVLVGGTDAAGLRVAQLATRVGLAFQDPSLQIFERSVRAEVELGPRNLGRPPERRARAVELALAATGLADDRDAHPGDLGAARRKLLTIAAVLAMETPLVVLDEPTAGLDHRGVERIGRIVGELGAAGRTVVVISHDLRFVAEVCERVVLLEAGRVTLDGSPAQVFDPRHWPALEASGLEPPAAARIGAALDLGATPTEAALAAALARGRGDAASGRPT